MKYSLEHTWYLSKYLRGAISRSKDLALIKRILSFGNKKASVGSEMSSANLRPPIVNVDTLLGESNSYGRPMW